MQIYELDLLITSRLDENEANEYFEKIRKDIEKNDIKILSSNLLGKINLAYPINKEAHAFFDAFILEMLPEHIANLKEILKHENKILRYFILKHKLQTAAPERKPQKKIEIPETISKNEDQEITIIPEIIAKEASPRPVSLGLKKSTKEEVKKTSSKPVGLKKSTKEEVKKTSSKPVGLKKSGKKIETKTTSPEVKKPKKEPKIKLEDIDKSLQKILEKEL